MAIIERITIPSTHLEHEHPSAFPGLRISIRSTTSSFSDYHEWSVDELRGEKQDSVVTDGACS